jgi:hypothetical protein
MSTFEDDEHLRRYSVISIAAKPRSLSPEASPGPRRWICPLPLRGRYKPLHFLRRLLKDALRVAEGARVHRRGTHLVEARQAHLARNWNVVDLPTEGLARFEGVFAKGGRKFLPCNFAWVIVLDGLARDLDPEPLVQITYIR